MKKKLIIIIAAVAVLLAAAAIVTIVIVSNKNKPDDTSSDGKILIPGYTEIAIEKDALDVSVLLQNPESNRCYFVYELVLKEGDEVLYRSDKIAPGESIEKITLSRTLSEGSYPAVLKITTTSVEDGSPMNGANVDTTIVAQ